ncbi:MAG: lysophospholipid acyltransferase family protein [Candidatus Muiribacteriota bacterium]
MKYIFYRLIGFLIVLLPVQLLYMVAEKIGQTAYFFWGSRRKIGLNNLKTAFPEKNKNELKSILKQTFINFAITFFEIFKQPYLKGNIEKIFKVEGLENLERAYQKNKGVLLITSHFGNWEVAGSLICLLGYKLAVVQKTQNNLAFDKLINYYRQLNGIYNKAFNENN